MTALQGNDRTATSTVHKETSKMTASRTRTAILALALALGVLLALAGSAFANALHEKQGSFPRSGVINFIAVDNSGSPSSGDLYIGELAEGTYAARVFQANASGTATGVDLTGKPFSFVNFGTFNVSSGPAVDDSEGANKGDIYVPDVENGVVDRFHENGTFDCEITGKGEHSTSTSECNKSPGSPEVPGGGFETALGRRRSEHRRCRGRCRERSRLPVRRSGQACG